MAFEVACGQCQGLLLVETTGVVVACPHCGAHLEIPADPAAASTPEPPPPPEPAPVPPPVAASEPAPVPPAFPFNFPKEPEVPVVGFPSFEPSPAAPPAPAPPAPTDVLPASVAPPPAFSAPAPAVESPAAGLFDFTAPAPVPAPAPSAPAPPPAAAAPPPAPAPVPSPAPTPSPAVGPAAASPSPAISIETGPRRPRGVSPFLFMMVLSYASAVTIAFAYFILTKRGGSTLDLPDLPPRAGMQLLDPKASLPGSHRLMLGETRQFGIFEVTPVRVTRGPIQFQHFSNPQISRAPSPPVLKLWLKFKNVSDQTCAPLDNRLVFDTVVDKKNPGRLRTNNFMYVSGRNGKAEDRHHVFVHQPDSEWDLKGQGIGRELGPDETAECYIPSNDEGAADLTGDLVWRVHFRKGRNRRSGHGVTTIIEVRFPSDAVTSESGPSA